MCAFWCHIKDGTQRVEVCRRHMKSGDMSYVTDSAPACRHAKCGSGLPASAEAFPRPYGSHPIGRKCGVHGTGRLGPRSLLAQQAHQDSQNACELQNQEGSTRLGSVGISLNPFDKQSCFTAASEVRPMNKLCVNDSVRATPHLT